MVVKCPRCNHFVNDMALTCPHCGAILKEEESSSKGAVTITVETNGMTIDVRTDPFYDTEKLIDDEFVDEESRLILQSYYEGRVISAKGVLTTFNGGHQIRVFNISDITFNEINE